MLSYTYTMDVILCTRQDMGMGISRLNTAILDFLIPGVFPIGCTALLLVLLEPDQENTGMDSGMSIYHLVCKQLEEF